LHRHGKMRKKNDRSTLPLTNYATDRVVDITRPIRVNVVEQALQARGMRAIHCVIIVCVFVGPGVITIIIVI